MPVQQVLGGRYEVERLIGRGGMADVFLARDRMLGREVAVKILHPAFEIDPSLLERFRREARSAASLSHPNIVAIYDWGQTNGNGDGGAPYMVMEYVSGPNLKESIRLRGPLPEEEALQIGIDIASALEAAHEHNIIHRDVKMEWW